jgi:hypothetical protein
VLFVARMPVPGRLMRAPAGASATATALRTIPAAHGTLETCARLLGNARAGGRLFRAWLLCFRSRVKIIVTFNGFVQVKFTVLYFVFPFVPFLMAFRVRFSVLFPVFGGSVGGHGHFVHFVGEGVGFVFRLFMVRVAIAFVIGFVFFEFVFRVCFQCILQFFQFGGFDKRFGHRFDRFRPVFGVRLRFFVLGFGKLLGQRSDFFVRKV